MTAIAWQVRVDGAPLPSEALDALLAVEAEDHAELAGIVRLRFATGLRPGEGGWSILDDDLFPRLARVVVEVTIGRGPAETLIEARVVETRAVVSNDPGRSTVEVVAVDPSVLMDLEERTRAWPNASDSDVASAIFAEHELVPDVESTPPQQPDTEHVTMQRGTDARFLKALARRNGFECFVAAEPLTGTLVGHFHPPRLDAAPQGVLSVSMGEETNVDSFAARFDHLSPAAADAASVDAGTLAPTSAGAASQASTLLGREPTLGGDRPRRVLLAGTGLSGPGELGALTQAVADRASWALFAEGALNAVAFGAVLRARRPVLVRGVGRRLSGAWYVERVLHELSGDGYRQRFTLKRNASGLTGREAFATGLGIPA